jgi:anti-sigma B factor antagonist
VEAALTTDARDGPELLVAISGELDLLTHEALRAALASLPPEPPPVIRLELSGLAFCDSRGLRILRGFDHRHRMAGREVVFADPSPTVRKLINLVAPGLLQPDPSAGLAS